MIGFAFLVAAALGGIVRWQAGYLNRPGRPLGTLAVNIVAAFAAGLAAGMSTTAALVITTAFLGSMSTFSTVVAEVDDLRSTSGVARSITYATVTCATAIAAAWIGLTIAN